MLASVGGRAAAIRGAKAKKQLYTSFAQICSLDALIVVAESQKQSADNG